MTRELSMLLKAGVTLDQALALLENDQGSHIMTRTISRLRRELSDGQNFADAIEAQGGIFPAIYTNMVRVGEVHGQLQEVLEQIAQEREQDQKTKSKLLSALLYPSFLVISAIGMIGFLLIFVIPQFKEIVMSSGAGVPDAARFVISLSDWLNANLMQLAVLALVGCLALTVLWTHPSVRKACEGIVLQLPFVGSLMQVHAMIRFCRTLATLTKSGVELPNALDLCRRVVSLQPASLAIGKSIEALRRGQDFIAPLAQSKVFPPVVTNMLRIGEETGNLSTSADYLAEMLQDKADVSTRRTMTILEPLIIILVSLLVAGVLLAILSAIVSVNDLVI
jgi:general secretion pathway protein F